MVCERLNARSSCGNCVELGKVKKKKKEKKEEHCGTHCCCRLGPTQSRVRVAESTESGAGPWVVVLKSGPLFSTTLD